MSPPRMVLAGTTYLVTRSCADRRFFVRPEPAVNEAFAYCVARAQRLHRHIAVHAASVQSNHYHLIVTDYAGDGELSDFMHALNTLFARFLLRHLRESHPERTLERLWARRSFSGVILATREAVLDKLAYVLTNPVKDLQVADYRKWPGFSTKVRHWTMKSRVYERPALYFEQTDDTLAELELNLTAPPLLLLGSNLERVTDEAEDYVLAQQRRLVEQHQTAGRTFLGAKAALRLNPFAQPGSRRKQNNAEPEVAAGGDPHMMRSAKQLLREFRRAYRDAWRCFVGGEDAVFPHGTLNMHRRYRCAIEVAYEVPWAVSARPG